MLRRQRGDHPGRWAGILSRNRKRLVKYKVRVCQQGWVSSAPSPGCRGSPPEGLLMSCPKAARFTQDYMNYITNYLSPQLKYNPLGKNNNLNLKESGQTLNFKEYSWFLHCTVPHLIKLISFQSLGHTVVLLIQREQLSISQPIT